MTTMPSPARSGAAASERRRDDGAFSQELRVRAAEASAAAQAADLLGEDLQGAIASSDLADLRSLAARNDVALDAVLDEVVLRPDPQD